MRTLSANRKRLIFTLLVLTGWVTVRAQSAGTLLFTENKGQWDKQVMYSADMREGGFYLAGDGYAVLTRQTVNRAGVPLEGSIHHGPGRFKDSVTVRKYLYTVQFLGANPHPVIMPDKPTGAYNNYFIGNDPTKWSAHCRVFQGVVYKDLYPGIDVRYYTDAGSLKYNLIVHPGADLSRVRLQYSGATGLYTKNSQLHVATPLGETVEMNPASFQPNDTGRTDVGCRYKVKGNVVNFSVGDYDNTNTLVIDPTFVFCSFTGSKGDNWGFSATYGADGSMYLAGIAQSGYLTTTGAYHPGAPGPDPNSGFPPDVAIIKLSPDGTKELWATYLGGALDDDVPTSMIENTNGDLVIGGHTRSADFPITVPRVGKGGGWDIFISKISNDGSTLMGSIVVGGTGQDGTNIVDNYEDPPGPQSLKQNYGDDSRGEVLLDANNNIFMASCSRSTDFPVIGGFQSANAGGANGQDGVVIKVNAAVNALMWSTYLGGSGDDAAYVIDRSPVTGQLYVGGGTESPTFPGVPASGVIGPVFNDGIANASGGVITDGFVSMLTDGGNTVTLDKTTYIGTGANDQVYGLKFDKLGFPYVTGQTLSAAWPQINAPYYIKGAKNFICKIQPDLSAYVYSTVFGTADASAPNIVPVAFLVDRCENVYVSGWGGKVNTEDRYASAGTFGLPITTDAYQKTTDGSDFYFFVMKKDAAGQLYGSFFGQYMGAFQEHVDGGTSRFDQNGVIYEAICANCYGGAVFPTGPADVFAFNNGTKVGGTTYGCNEAGVKLALNLAGVGSGVKASIAGKAFSNLGCIPLQVGFTDTVGNAVTYEWNFGDGSPVQTTTVPATSHTYTNTGVFQIMLISIDSSSCNISDTSYATIRAGSNKANVGFTDFKIPPCTSLTYQFNDTSTLVAGDKPFTDSSFVWSFGAGGAPVKAGLDSETYTYPAPGDYTVQLILVDTNYCNAPDTVSEDLHVAINVKAQFSTPSTGCTPYNAQFTDNSIGGTQWSWNFGDPASGSNTSTIEDPTHLYTSPGSYTIKLVVTDTSTCNKVDSTTQTIQLATKPTAAFTWGPNPAIANTPVVFTNNSSEDAVTFKWLFGDGDTLVTSSRDTVSHQYNATGAYNACLIATNATGCSDTTCQTVNAITIPELDVPNAFTPGRFGENGVIKVRGYAVASMDWKIYNRWGQLVFESLDLDTGWDGNFRGQLQPMDVYAYTLSVVFTNGTHAVKTGDITLLR